MRTWERSPQLFADTLATSLAGQALFDYAPLAERARRVLSKLRQVPRFMQAARDNLKDSKDSPAPGIFIKVGLESLRGTLRFIHDDLPARVCRSRRFAPARRPCRCGGRGLELDRMYVEFLETDVAPRSKGSFRLGRDRFERKLTLDKASTVGADRLLAIATRELQATQDEFRRVASPRVIGGDPLAAWQKTKADHPRAGELVPVAESQLAELADFIRREQIISLPKARRWFARRRVSIAGPPRACGHAGTCSSQGRSGRSTTSPTSIRPGRRSGRTSTCAISTTARSAVDFNP